MNPRAKHLLMRAASNTTHAVRMRCTSDDYPVAMLCVDGGFFDLEISDAGSKFTLTLHAKHWLIEQGYKPAPFSPETATNFLDAVGLADFAVMNDADVAELRKYVAMWRQTRGGGGSVWVG